MFNLEKSIQACYYLLKKNNFSLNYTKLIKLLYLADKKSLEDSLQTITGDTYVSMQNGPVLSKLYDLIMDRYRNENMQDFWNSHFSRDEYNLTIKTNHEQESLDELSPFELQTLDKIYNQFENYSLSQIIDYVHNNCPEWQDPEGSAIPIKAKDILKSIGRTPDEIEWILAEAESFEEEEIAFHSLAKE